MERHIRIVYFEIKMMIYHIFDYLLNGISQLSRIPEAENDCVQNQIET